jgi:acyl-CoA hydrolase
VEARTVEESRSVLVQWMGPTHANSAGFVHGGVVMKLIDEVAGVAAVRHSRSRVVTAGADRLTFLQPVHVGELVTLQASVNAVWHTSMEVGVRVETENPRTGETRHTNTAYLTMVALDDDGAPAEVPPIEPHTAAEERRNREAELRRANRLAVRSEIVAHRERAGERT